MTKLHKLFFSYYNQNTNCKQSLPNIAQVRSLKIYCTSLKNAQHPKTKIFSKTHSLRSYAHLASRNLASTDLTPLVESSQCAWCVWPER